MVVDEMDIEKDNEQKGTDESTKDDKRLALVKFHENIEWINEDVYVRSADGKPRKQVLYVPAS